MSPWQAGISNRFCNRRIVSRNPIAEMHLLEQDCVLFLNGRPAIKGSVVGHQDRVFGIESGYRRSIVIVNSLVEFLSEREELLPQFWIGGTCLSQVVESPILPLPRRQVFPRRRNTIGWVFLR
jgi:hypothetical protein